MKIFLAIATAASAILCGCGNGSSARPPLSTTRGTSSAPATVTTTAATSTTLDLIPQTSPDVAAVALLNAWLQGDPAGASRVATPTAISDLFAHAPQPFSDRQCQDPVAGTSSCAFGIGAGLVTIHTVTLAGGWLVDGVTFA